MKIGCITEEDAPKVKGMIERGDRQSDIATYFGVNPGRIAEIATGQRYAEITGYPADSAYLPPPGPYHVGEFLALLESAIRVKGEPHVAGVLRELGEGS